MGTLHMATAPPPALYVAGDRPAVVNAYFAVTVDAAVDLAKDREYRGLPRAEWVSKARAEQREFLNGFLDPALGMALDLRVTADPTASSPVSVTVLGRVWGNDTEEVTTRGENLRAQVHAAMPRHVTATAVENAADVSRLLSPFGGTQADSAVITRRELIGLPSRPDAGVSYYYSATPFNWPAGDWSAVYSALAASPVPVILSVAVLPVTVPPQFVQTLLTLATFYGRLARDGEMPGGRYPGRHRLAPDAFAVDAEHAFHDFSRRLAEKAFALRIQVSAARRLPPGIVEAIAGAISPAERADGFPGHQKTASTCDVRRPASVAERRLAEYNLNVINVGMLTGRPEIWARPDPPDPQLAMLSVLGDADDAAGAFRFPIAADGIAGGFAARHGQPARDKACQANGPAPGIGTVPKTGPVLRIGKISGTDVELTVPLRSLAGYTLITGSAGSGTTTTALELLRQLWAEHRTPFLAVEPVRADADDYRKLAAEPGFESLEVVTVGDENGAPLRFNPFEVPAGVLVGEHIANLRTCFTAAFGLPGPLPFIYQDALNLTYLRSGFLAAERPVDDKRAWPTVVEFVAAMGEVIAGLGYAGDIATEVEAASIRRAQRLLHGAAGSVFLTDRRGDVGRLLDHPAILELKSLGAGDVQALVVALLLNAAAEHRLPVRGGSPPLAHVTLVEEAHRLLTRAVGTSSRCVAVKGEAAELFANTLAENRRHGEGVIIVERSPAKLAAGAIKNANLRVVHRLTAGEDWRYLSEVSGMDRAQRLSVARLPAGEALVYGDMFAEAAHASITTTLGADVPPPGVVTASVTAPFDACDRCRARCAYRGAALSMIDDPVIVAGITDATDAATRAGLSPAEQRNALAELRGALYGAVDRFAALPTEDPGRSDAAFCLFLHVHAVSAPCARPDVPDWPTIVARCLAIPDPRQTPTAP